MRGELDDKAVPGFLESTVKAAAMSPERLALERAWFVNHAYYHGAQLITMNQGVLQPGKPSKKRRQLHQANYVIVKINKAVARLITMVPEYTAPPRSSSWDDMNAADVASQLFDHMKRATRFSDGLRRALTWAAICGSSFKKVCWDPDAGDEFERVYLNEDGSVDALALLEKGRARDRERAGLYDDVPVGEARSDVYNPYEIKWDPDATEEGLRSCAWVAIDHYVPIHRLQDRYGDLPFRPEESSIGELYRQNIAFMASPNESGGWRRPQSNEGAPQRARVIEYWEPRLRRNGMRGRWIIMAGGVVVKNGPNPYGDLPFVMYHWFPPSGRFLGTSLVEQIRVPQRAYNFARSHEQEFMRVYGFPPVMMPKSAAVKAVQMPSFPGSLWEYNGPLGQMPQPLQMPRLPDSVLTTAQNSKNEMDEISAQASPSKDAYPSQVRSGSAIGLIQGENNAVLTPIAHAMFESIGEEGSKLLDVADQFYSDGRLISVLHDGGLFETRQFREGMLRGHTRLQVRGEPGMVESPESARQTVLDAVAVNALQPATDPRDRALFYRAMKFNTAHEVLDLETRQMSRERMILRRMIEDPNSAPPDVFPWEDPNVRLPIVEHFLNSATFDTLDPLVKEKVQLRYEQMRLIREQAQAAQLQLLSSTKGAPGQKGVASQPAAR